MRRLAALLLLVPSLAFAFTAPIGIPTPSFPSDLDVAQPSKPSPWTSEQAGNYYVEPGGSCSDARTYGYPGTARCTLPASPSAGANIWFHGTLNAAPTISYTGTSGSPIWVMAYDMATHPNITGEWAINSTYTIFDGIDGQLTPAQASIGVGGNKVMVRNGVYTNSYSSANHSGMYTAGTNLVFYLNTYRDQGDWQWDGADVDVHCTLVTSGSDNVWFLDSEYYHCQGDGIQVGGVANAASAINRIYIGRNTSYENLQSCFWTKNATDVIMSENICHDIDLPAGAASADGQGMGGQYDAENVWFIANNVYNTKAGIKIQGPNNGGGGPWYFVGNLIHDVFADNNCNNYGMGAIAYRNDGGATAVFNTVYNVDSFVTAPVGGTIIARNNIFSVKQGICDATQVDITFTHDFNLWSDASYDPGSEANRQIEVASSTFTSAGTDFTLKSDSLAVDSANTTEEPAFAAFESRYGIDIRMDILSATRPASATDWDLGAYEYTEGGGDPPATVPVLSGGISFDGGVTIH